MHSRNRWAVLAVVCASVYLINLDITIVNAALPTLVRELRAGTRDLQWIVDAYNLTFAAFVLAAGSLSDRYGRRTALVTGLAIFGTGTAAGAAAGTTGGLIAARLVMGVGAAVIFPTTLSIISNTFSDRRERARSVGSVELVGVERVAHVVDEEGPHLRGTLLVGLAPRQREQPLGARYARVEEVALARCAILS